MSDSPDARRKGGAVQSILGGLSVLVFVGASVYSQFIRTANEVGPVGMDTDGRGILLQSLTTPVNQVGSEWEDSNLIQRLIIQEPMRTTFRIRSNQVSIGSPEIQRGLDAPFDIFPDTTEGIWLTKADKVPISEFNLRLKQLGVRSVAELLAAMGFRRYEIYESSVIVFETVLPVVGAGNTRIAGLAR